MADVTVRNARPEDAGAIAELSEQLGYSIDSGRTAGLLSGLPGGNVVLVAVRPDDTVVGWLQVILREDFLISDGIASLGGIVVDELHRGQGIGRILMEAGEDWAAQLGATEIMLNSNTKRHDTHRFYERIGYTRVKTQARYVKRLKL